MKKVKLEIGNKVFQVKVVRASPERGSLWEWKLNVGFKRYCKGRFGQEVGGPETLGFKQV